MFTTTIPRFFRRLPYYLRGHRQTRQLRSALRQCKKGIVLHGHFSYKGVELEISQERLNGLPLIRLQIKSRGLAGPIRLKIVAAFAALGTVKEDVEDGVLYINFSLRSGR